MRMRRIWKVIISSRHWLTSWTSFTLSTEYTIEHYFTHFFRDLLHCCCTGCRCVQHIWYDLAVKHLLRQIAVQVLAPSLQWQYPAFRSELDRSPARIAENFRITACVLAVARRKPFGTAITFRPEPPV
jgi:hypothetical protein